MPTVRGISGLVLLPARDYEWALVGRYSIRVPIRGKVSELLKGHEFASGVKISGDDDFSIFEDDVFLLWELVRVMFAEAKYPALKEDECFSVAALEIDGDEVIVHGEVIRSVTE